MIDRDIFEELFVLEMSINHRGSMDRAYQIIKEHSRIVRFNNIRAAIKLQFRDVDSLVHKDFRDRQDIKYIKKIMARRLPKSDHALLVNYIKKSGCIPMATPFDEESVQWCEDFELPIIKIASSDCNDWTLIERISKTRKPVIVSVGGVSIKDLDDMVTFFESRDIPLAINHCVSAYPHEDFECEINQVDFLINRYPGHTIGYSCHEYRDWETSITIAYAKGARTFERHIDINSDGTQVEKYCSVPEHTDRWFKAFKRAKEFCGLVTNQKIRPLQRELAYLDTLVRGVYAKRDLQAGEILSEDDIYLAIPLQKGQLSTRELMLRNNDTRVLKDCAKDAPVTIETIDSPYAHNEELSRTIHARGL